MKKDLKWGFCAMMFLLLVPFLDAGAQEEEKPELLVNMSYHVINNSSQYVKVQTRIRENKRLEPVKNVVIQVYLDSVAPENLISKNRTNANGEAFVNLPAAFRDKWRASSSHTFIAITEATSKEDETVTELGISRARILIDTLNEEGARSVTATVMALENDEWVPVPDVEVKVGVKRMGGTLNIGEEETYTTDAAGQVAGEFGLQALPSGDTTGTIMLIARIEDHDSFGNLSVEKAVPWGVHQAYENNFEKRSLWATRDKSPIWLLIMAYSIIAAVWGVIIYLVFMLIRIKKEGSKKITKHVVHTAGELVSD